MGVPWSSVKSSSVPSRESCRPLKMVPESWRNGVGVSRPLIWMLVLASVG